MRIGTLLASAASVAFALPADEAHAQSSPVTKAPVETSIPLPAEQIATQSDIVVTAQKRAERLQDVPVPVSVVTAETLTTRNQVRIQDYFSTVPGLNLTATGNGQQTIAIRGLSSAQASNPTVGVLIDDVPFGSSTGIGFGSRLLPDLDPAELDRVEVLRGPQGTLYGVSSIGGVLKFVTTDPSLERASGRIQADVAGIDGGDIGFGLRGSINLPTSESFAIRAGGFFRRDGGYVDNVATGENNVNRNNVVGGRLAALWKPSSAFSLRLGAIVQRNKGEGVATIDANSQLRPALGDLKQSRVIGSGDYRITSQLYSATMNLDLGRAQLTSITGYGVNKYYGISDTSSFQGGTAKNFFAVGSSININNFTTKKFSEELRVAADLSSSVDLLAGVFYTHERTDAHQITTARRTATGEVVGLLIDAQFPGTFEEYAAFGDLTVHFTSRFDVQLGGRYSHNSQTYHETDTGVLLTQDIFAKSDDNAFTFLVTPRFRVSEDLMAYARVASGYRAGGPNPGAGLGFPATFGPDKTVNYELGLKGRLFDRGLTYDLSLYHIDWNDIQLSLRDPNGFRYYVNGPRAKSEGVELTLGITPMRGLNIAAEGSYNVAELTRDLPAIGGFAKSGDRLPYSARWSGSVSVDQAFPLGNALDGFIGGSVTYVGRRQGEFVQRVATGIRSTYPAYTTLDLRTGVKWSDWSANLFVSNVTNKRGVIGGEPAASNHADAASLFFVNFIRPRVFGASLAKKF